MIRKRSQYMIGFFMMHQYRPYLCFEENNNGNNEVTYQVLSTSKKTSSTFTETQDNDLITASENDSGLIRSNRTLQES